VPIPPAALRAARLEAPARADLLVRALPVALGKSQEEEIRESHKTLGADDFFNLRDEVVRHGKEAALERLRDCVLGRLPRFSAAAS
jgi:hypothetical protein